MRHDEEQAAKGVRSESQKHQTPKNINGQRLIDGMQRAPGEEAGASATVGAGGGGQRYTAL